MQSFPRTLLRRAFLLGAALMLTTVPGGIAQVVPTPSQPQVGSENPVTPLPPVARPHTQPCIVPLFTNQEFADFNAKTFSYTPPAACPGPWAKVVFTADFTVTAGRQFDRTAEFFLGHANIYYGTTAEPTGSLSPSWHVERDVTDLSAIFKTPQTGEADLGNFVGTSGGVVYNGIIYANAKLEFYPASWVEPAPSTPDMVLPLPDAAGGAQALNTTSSLLTETYTFPKNVERAYLDLFAQSQSADEFWYSCVPSDVANELVNCPNTGFREAEITIDGRPAGVAPIYPWIYTGGIDPQLWKPLPGVQTLDFVPYRVDLTPFAGVLSNGQQHSVAVSVFNADSYFLAAGNILLYLDHGSASVSGSVTQDTLTPEPAPNVVENITTTPPSTYTGTLTVTSGRNFVISGYVNTSHGRVQTTVEQHINFVNAQQIDAVNPDVPVLSIQNVTQSTDVRARTTTQDRHGVQVTDTHFSYPLVFDYNFAQNSDGTFTQVASIQQKLIKQVTQSFDGFPYFHSREFYEVSPSDTLALSSGYSITGNSNQKSMAKYVYSDSFGRCYSRTLTAANNVLTAVKDGQACGDGDDGNGGDGGWGDHGWGGGQGWNQGGDQGNH